MFIPLKDENPTSRFPFVTVCLIALNIFIFLYQLFSPQAIQYFVYKMAAVPYEITHFTPVTFVALEFHDPILRLHPALTLLTCMFLHGSFLHIFGNMLYLWIFGNNVEDFLGHFRFIIFYLISGLGASFIHILFHVNSKVPMIGASGAIAGVLGAYLILYPGAKVLTLILIWIVPIPAAIVLGIWFLGQIMNIGIGGGVAWFAHIGGFIIGILLIRYYLKKRRRVWIR